MNNDIIKEYFDEFNEMVGEMKHYVYTTGHELEVCNDEQKLEFGFIDSVDKSKWFVIKIGSLKVWATRYEATEGTNNFSGLEQVDLIMRAFQTNEGQKALCAMANNAKK